MKNEITDLFHPVLRDPGVARPATLGEGGVLEGKGAGVLEEVSKNFIGINCAISVRITRPLIQVGEGGSTPTIALHSRELTFEPCEKSHAVALVRLWHSRLPGCQNGPWQYAFRAQKDDVTYAVALWSNPCTRSLPHHWIELRRMACSPDCPKNTPSRMISWMVRHFKKVCPDREKCISYQDLDVHTGTIYKAAGWSVEYISKPRVRDRSKNRVGTNRMYRSNKNGIAPDAAGKARWAKLLTPPATVSPTTGTHAV
jgi:hypothetical protein